MNGIPGQKQIFEQKKCRNKKSLKAGRPSGSMK
jgi:hypothetical protein